jgi:tripartite-type tricarboxylate transporter receptor subunit TctC
MKAIGQVTRHKGRGPGLCLSLVPFLLSLYCCTASAQQYPVKPIRFIVPFPPGGTADLIVRLVSDKLTKSFGQPVVIDNRSGAGGSIGTEALVRAAPDGHTIGLGVVSTLCVNPAVFSKLPYDVNRDLAPVTNMAAVPTMFMVNPSVNARSVAELVALSKAKPGTLSYGTPGNASLGHLRMEHFKLLTGANLQHVPYKGAGQSLADAVSGQIQVVTDQVTSSLPFVKAGRLRAIVVNNPKRLDALPEVPTFSEAGLPELNVLSWFGVLAPGRTPPAIVTRLHDATVEALKQPDVQEKLAVSGAFVVGNSPAEYAAQIRSEGERLKKVAKAVNIRAD